VTRLAGAAAVAGPASFITAWVVGGVQTSGYDPIVDTISRLARLGTPTRGLMTGGLVAFGLLVPLAAPRLGRLVGTKAVTGSLLAAGGSSLAVAAFPLGVDGAGTGSGAHAAAAGVSYVAMAATPLLAARGLRRSGRRGGAGISAAAGLVAAAALTGSILLPPAGGLQRLGLTVVDAWIIAAGITALRADRLRRRPSTPPSAPAAPSPPSTAAP